jgi:hypothetical protein
LLALSYLFLISAGAWAGEANTSTGENADGTRSRSLAQQIVQHLSNANIDANQQNGLDDVARIAQEGPLLSYSLVIDIDNPDPIATSQELLANGYPYSFDFETGLQGWKLEGSAERVNTQVLSGEWAIFGDGLADDPARMSIELDLTDVASIEVDRFYLGGFDGVAAVTLRVERDGNPFFTAAFDASANPARLLFDVGNLPGERQVTVEWSSGVPCGTPELSCPAVIPPTAFLALVDNITFQPIPEPSTLLLALIGLASAAAVARAGRFRG